MTKIQNYVENVFAGLPKTKEAVEMKLGIIDSMEEKYSELLSMGKNENEAFGEVIADFGSIEEIREELGLAQPRYESVLREGSHAPSAPLETTDAPSDPDDFNQFQKKFRLAITTGVVFCILALIGTLVTERVSGEDSNAPAIVFFCFIAVAVGIFVYFGMQYSAYENKRAAQSARHTSQNRGNEIVDALCGIIMLVATVIFLFLGFFGGLWHPGWVVFPIGGVICGIVDIVAKLWKKS